MQGYFKSTWKKKKAKKTAVIDFVRKLKLHAKTEEDLTYPTVLMTGKLLKQDIIRNGAG
jgi:isochorismate hydrolase